MSTNEWIINRPLILNSHLLLQSTSTIQGHLRVIMRLLVHIDHATVVYML